LVAVDSPLIDPCRYLSAEDPDVATEEPQPVLLGRRTYEALAGLPDEASDDSWRRMTELDKVVFSDSRREPVFANMASAALELVDHRTLDGRVLLVEYRPTGSDIPRPEPAARPVMSRAEAEWSS
jgi:hypothetical protein